jgi:hypothetical protein
MDDIVEQVKAANKIEDVIADTHPLEGGRGRYVRARGHDSLVIDVHNQAYHWNSAGEHGDVIAWVMNRTGTDFKATVEFLARRANLPEPQWGAQDGAARMAAQARQSAWEVATNVMQAWLLRSPEAIDYCHGRGWSDETIQHARIGWTGLGSERKALAEAMREAMQAAGVDPRSPAAVAVLGYSGDVSQWGRDCGVEVREDWVERGWIPGVVGQGAIVYPHVAGGRVVYLSLRGVLEKRHYNLPVELAGERRVYLAWSWSSREQSVTIVEGQADAISLAQWGIPAVALAGTAADAGLAGLLSGNPVRYIGLDADKAGTTNAGKIAQALGPLTRLVRWDALPGYASYTVDGEERQVKDANDLLRAMANAGGAAEKQADEVATLIIEAQTYVEFLARLAGEAQGARRDDAQRDAFAVIRGMDEVSRMQYRTRLCKAMGITVREFDGILKRMAEQAKKEEKEDSGEPIYTLGGALAQGWLVDYVYNPEDDEAKLVWRTPTGEIGMGERVIIDGRTYLPEPPGKPIRDGVVLFAGDLGELRSTRELVAMAEMFIRSYYLLDNPRTAKIMAYYVLLTWVYDCFSTLPYLRAVGEAGAGKSELMKRVGFLCYRTMTASGANTAASFFRGVEKFRGTVFIDEADLQDGGDMSNDLVKFLNLGAMRGNAIWRLEEHTGPDGARVYDLATYSTFCPKLIAMRRDFKDDAVASRSLTFKLLPREAIELRQAGIPLSVDAEFRRKALVLRNMLLRWRMEHWQPEIQINENDIDFDISSRLNQVTLPLLALAADDLELKQDIRQVLRDLYAEQVLNRSMTITARIIEALWKINRYPDLKHMVHTDANGMQWMLIGDVCRVTNEIMDEMNSSGNEEQDEQAKKKRKELTPRYVGELLRGEMMLRVLPRTRQGYPVMWDEGRMIALSKRYGIDPDQQAPRPDEKAQQKPQQGVLA